MSLCILPLRTINLKWEIVIAMTSQMFQISKINMLLYYRKWLVGVTTSGEVQATQPKYMPQIWRLGRRYPAQTLRLYR